MSVESTSSLSDHRKARDIAIHLPLKTIKETFSGEEPLSKLVMHYFNNLTVLQMRVERVLKIDNSIHTQLLSSEDCLKVLELCGGGFHYDLLVSDNINIVKLGLFAGYKPTQGCLEVAISNKRTIITALLLNESRKNVSLNWDNLLHRSVSSGSLEIVKMILDEPNCSITNDSALKLAVTRGHKDTIQYLLAETELKNVQMEVLLETACYNGDINIIELMLSYTNGQFAPDWCGWRNALVKAAVVGRVAVIELLLESRMFNNNLANLQLARNNTNFKTIRIRELLDAAISKLPYESKNETTCSSVPIQYACICRCPIHSSNTTI